MKSRKKSELLKIFEELYPEPRSELVFNNEYQLLISVILSAQCTDKKVNEVTPELFSRFPSFEALAKARISTVESIIRPVNYYRTKSANIIATAKKVSEEFSGKLPHNHDEIISLPGVGRKTANVVLGELGVAPTFPVDTHVFRLTRRLGLSSGENPREVEEEIMKDFDPKLWRSLHHWLILHGRRVCKAQKPLCSECAVAKYCPSAKK